MRKSLIFIFSLVLLGQFSASAQFGCGTGIAITNGYTQTGITTPGTGGSEDWNINPTGTSINVSYWDDDVYLFEYTAGATVENISMTIFTRNSWNGIGIFDDCTGTTFSTELDADGSSTSNISRTVSATIAAGNTVYIAVGQWGTPDNLDFDVTDFTVTAVSCLDPSALAVNNVTTTTADVSWTAGGGSSTEIVTLPSGAPAPTGGNTLDATTANPSTVTGLTSATDYDVYIRDVCAAGSALMISGIYDISLPGGLPKGVELYAVEDITDLSQYGLGSANNGGGSDGEEFTFPAVSVSAGTYIYVASEAVEFTNYFGFAPDYTSGSMGINGDDALELFYNGAVVDVFGDINVDGTGQAWEYLDGWAYRNTSQLSNNGSFNVANWTFSGINAADGCTDNATCGSVMPIATFTTSIDVSAWVGPVSFTTLCNTYTPTYLTDFSTFLPACWDEADGGDESSGPTGFGTGNWNQDVTTTRINLYTTGTSDWLITPTFDLSAGGWELVFEASAYDYSFASGSTGVFSGMGSDDSLQVLLSTDGGATWTIIYNFDATNNPLTLNPTDYIIDLSPYTGTNNIFGFRASEGAINDIEDYYAVLDRFEIRTPPSCAAPTNLAASNILETSADISWTSANGAQLGWEVSVVPTGGSPVGGTAGTSPYTASGLASATSYDVYVREICASGDTSAWTGPITFTTACPAVVNGDDQSTAIAASLPFSATGATDICFTDAYDGGANGNTAPDVWYEMTVGSCMSSVTASLCGSAYDTRLYILDATGTQIGYNDDDCGLQSEIILDYATAGVSPGDVLYIIVDGFSSSSGSYTLNITEAVATPGTAAIAVDADASCNAGNDGQLTASTSGGAAAASYVWSNATTAATATALAAGTYDVTITDVLGCTATASGIVNEPTAIAPTVDAVVDASCNGGNDGSISISVAGGTAPYSFSWSNGATTEDLTGLVAGAYTGTITDANGCTLVAGPLTINEPTAIAPTVDAVVDASCNGGNDGSISISVAGGTAPYSFSWSNGATTEDLTGLVAGAYTGTITDANGCTLVAGPLTINEPTAIAPTVDAVVDASCNGGNDGSISISVTGGTAPYSFNWSNGATTEDLTGLVAGAYTGTITDANGCTLVAGPLTINEPTAIAPTVDAVVDASCNGGNDGSISISVAGGTAPYSFSWSNGATTEDLIGLVAGAYTGTITDANGCTLVAGPIAVNEPTAIAPTVDAVTDANCGASDGGIDISVSGGTAPYTFLWSNGATTEDLTALAAGAYTGTITDANGCTLVAGPITVGNITTLAGSTTSVDVLCNAGATGSIDLTVSGGATPYTFVWSNGATTEDLSGLVAGTYDATITDNNGCIINESVTINEPTAIAPTVDATTDASCNGAADGSISITVAGGTAPYTFNWSNGATTEDLTALAAGAYTGTITDANGCTLVAGPIAVNEPTAITPTVDATVNASCNGAADGSISISVAGGTAPYTFNWSNGATTEDLTALAAGAYTGTITDANGCTLVAGPITINEPDTIGLTASVTDVTAAGGSDGAIDITVTGGTAPYTFNWSDGSTTEDLTGLVAGSYTGTITDANGCTTSATVTVLDGPSSIAINNNDIDVKLYPNPTQDHAFLGFELATASDVELQIINVTGQVIQTRFLNNIKNENIELDVKDMPAGMYLIQLTIADKQITKKLIVTRP